MTDDLRVLLIAPHCDPTDVGEARSTFEWTSRLSERCGLTVLTYRLRKAPPVAPLIPRARVIEWVDLPLVGRFERMNAGIKPGYFWFYSRARSWIRAALRRGERFSLAHQISPLAMRYPSPAAGLVDPLIVGPLAGSLPNPRAFAGELSSEAWYARLRRFDDHRFRADPWLRRTYSRAAVVIGVAPYVREILEGAGVPLRRFEVMSETGVHSHPALSERARSEPGALRLLYVGRVVRTKGLRDAVRAVARLRDLPGVTLDAIGDGPDLEPCRREAAELGVRDRVSFHGRVPRQRVDDFYRSADAFVFPSFREPSGNVVFEAMSFGLPLVVADRGGPAQAADESCAFRVPVTDPERYATEIASAVRTLALDLDTRRRMGDAARSRAEALGSWEGKVDWLHELYRSVSVGANPVRVDRASVSASGAHA